MKRLLLLFVLLISTSILGQSIDIEKSVVKIYSAKQSYSFEEPWKSNSISRSTSTGFVIANKRIITNAHAVSNCRYLQVRFGNSSKKINAEVEFISDDYDLAILKFVDEKELPELSPLEFESSLNLKDKIVVYGYPMGGDKLSITEGIISRVQRSKYTFSQKTFTVIQTDAAINPGNSGGPIIKGDKVIGVAFQGIIGSSNIGYAIPSHIVNHFLNDIKDGVYEGIPTLGIKVLNLESSIHRKMLGMNEDETGILVKEVADYSSLNEIIEKNDVILKIDNKEVGVDGSIEFSDNSRIGLGYILEHKKYGDDIKLEVLRGGKRLVKTIRLIEQKKTGVVDSYQSNALPSYYITSGFIFEKLSVNYLNKYLKANRIPRNSPNDLIKLLEVAPDSLDEIVFIVSVLPDLSNEGYQNLRNVGISKVNGVKVQNFNQFIKLLKKERYAVLTDLNGDQIVIDNELSKARDIEIKNIYNISSLMSKDLMTQ